MRNNGFLYRRPRFCPNANENSRASRWLMAHEHREKEQKNSEHGLHYRQPSTDAVFLPLHHYLYNND